MPTKRILIELQYLGCIPYYSTLLKYPKIIIEQFEHYNKGSFRNRFFIATAQGPLGLSIPLKKGKHQQMPIRKIEIDNTTPWQSLHWKSIQTAYGKAPFFDYYADLLRPFFEKEYQYLFDFSWDLQQLILQVLQLPQDKITLSKEYISETSSEEIDLRGILRPKNYLNFQTDAYTPIPYPQLFEDRLGFLPNLSILDLLFCCGPASISFL